MAIIKWKGKIYSFTIAWPLILLAFITLLALIVIPIATYSAE